MSGNLMEQARRALREARHEDAQAILINVIAREPEDDEAWILLAEALSDASKKRECLERARKINPRNPAILRALELLTATMAQAALLPADTAAALPPAIEPVSVAASPALLRLRRPAAASPAEATTLNSAESPSAALLDYAELVARTVLMTTDPTDTCHIGRELLKILDQAAERDAATAKRWAQSVGRAALTKYDQALYTLIRSSTLSEPQLADLHALRQRVLEYVK